MCQTVLTCSHLIHVHQAFPFALKCTGTEGNNSTNRSFLFLKESLKNELFSPQQQSQPSNARWHVWAGKEQRLCPKRAIISHQSWASILCKFCSKTCLPRFSVCYEDEQCLCTYWSMTCVLRSRNITDPWQNVDSYEFNRMILTLCMMQHTYILCF